MKRFSKQGEYLNGKRWNGKGIEYYPNDKEIFIGGYEDGLRSFGNEYYEDEKIKYEGLYLDGKYYTGKLYSKLGGKIYEIYEGKDIPEEFYENVDYEIKYEDTNLTEEKNRKGKEYFKQKLTIPNLYLINSFINF